HVFNLGFGCLTAEKTWNAALSEMIECGVVADVDVDVDTDGYLIQAFCDDNKVSKGYELLRRVLVDGLVPGNAAFNKLISGSNILEKERGFRGLRVFNDLNYRGYAPDIAMYTTMIHGLCTMGWLGEARKLWFEMIEKGYRPNKFTYNTMIHGFWKIGHFERAKILYKEMCGGGHKETRVSYKAIMTGLCLHGRTDEAYRLEGKIVESMNLLRELLTQGLQPSACSYTPLIKGLCQVVAVQEAKTLWNDMKNRGLEPSVSTHDEIIIGLCDQGDAADGFKWLIEMLKTKRKPKRETPVSHKEIGWTGYALEKGTSVCE
ncbi:unnamed protein product, partial [Prunus brigantina]